MPKTDKQALTDGMLVQSVMAGKREAFGVLVERYRGMLYGYLNRRVSCFADVEDLVQESFMKAFFKLEQFDQERHFGLWLKGICRNSSYRFFARGKRGVDTICLEDAGEIEDKSVQNGERDNVLVIPLRY